MVRRRTLSPVPVVLPSAKGADSGVAPAAGPAMGMEGRPGATPSEIAAFGKESRLLHGCNAPSRLPVLRLKRQARVAGQLRVSRP
jgi:hypothetical protein